MRKVLWVSLLLLWCSLFISCKGMIDYRNYCDYSQYVKDLDRLRRDPEYIKLKKEKEFADKKILSHAKILKEYAEYKDVDGFDEDGLYFRDQRWVLKSPHYKQKVELHEKKWNEWGNKAYILHGKMRDLEDRKLKEYAEERKRRAAEKEEEGRS